MSWNDQLPVRPAGVRIQVGLLLPQPEGCQQVGIESAPASSNDGFFTSMGRGAGPGRVVVVVVVVVPGLVVVVVPGPVGATAANCSRMASFDELADWMRQSRSFFTLKYASPVMRGNMCVDIMFVIHSPLLWLGSTGEPS